MNSSQCPIVVSLLPNHSDEKSICDLATDEDDVGGRVDENDVEGVEERSAEGGREDREVEEGESNGVSFWVDDGEIEGC